MAGPTLMLWLKSEPFTIGTLPLPPHPRLTISNIRKIVSYAKSKGQHGYPNLSYSVWKHIACNKLQLPEDLAWTYFVTFDLINGLTPAQHLERDRKFVGSTDPKAIEVMRNRLSVPTIRFVLFLYLQHIHKISLRASLVSGSDEWPSRTKSPDLESRGTKGMDENFHLTFVLNNLSDLLETISEPAEPESGAGDVKSLTVSAEAVLALGLLIAGSLDGSKTVSSLYDIATMHTLQQKTGFLRSAQNFSLRSFQTWLRSHFSNNPFGMTACLASGQRVDWPLLDESNEKSERVMRGQIVSNGSNIRKEHIRGNKLIVLSKVSKETVARCSSSLEGTTIKIHRCHHSFIYILAPLRSVSIEKCAHSTIVLGAVESAVDLIRCESTTVIAACRRFSTIGSKACTMHLLTPNRPLIFSGNESLTFAPYNTFYGKLEEHMDVAGLNSAPSLWNQPLNLGTEYPDDAPVWELMPPALFHTLCIPFDIKGPTKELPAELPGAYQKSVDGQTAHVEAWQRLVRKAKLSREHRKAFSQIVETRFQEWLHASASFSELEGLSADKLSKKVD